MIENKNPENDSNNPDEIEMHPDDLRVDPVDQPSEPNDAWPIDARQNEAPPEEFPADHMTAADEEGRKEAPVEESLPHVVDSQDPEAALRNKPSLEAPFAVTERASDSRDQWLTGPPPFETPFASIPETSVAEDPWQTAAPFEPPFVPIVYTPETTQETVRQSGLAWSSGIVFFGSVVFMLFLGWIADLLMGSSPWGIVGGVILGSIIGFIQFFRISSRIFPSRVSEHRPLLTREDDEEQPPQF